MIPPGLCSLVFSGWEGREGILDTGGEGRGYPFVLSRSTPSLPHPHRIQEDSLRCGHAGELSCSLFFFFQASELRNREVGQIRRWMCCG